MSKNLHVKLSSLVFLVSFAAVSQADVAYDNFAVGDAYAYWSGWIISGNSSFAENAFVQGDQFTSLTTGTLVSVTVGFMGLVVVGKHLLNFELAPAVRIQRRLGMILIDRNV